MNDIKHDIKKRHKNLTEFRYIAVGFFLTILSGAIMLSLPFSSRDGQWTNFLDSLFYGNKRNLCDRSCCV